MSNHVHIVARPVPAQVAGWSPEEVVRRWWLMRADIDPEDPAQADERPTQAEVDHLAADADFVASWRERLGTMGWFMKT